MVVIIIIVVIVVVVIVVNNTSYVFQNISLIISCNALKVFAHELKYGSSHVLNTFIKFSVKECSIISIINYGIVHKKKRWNSCLVRIGHRVIVTDNPNRLHDLR